MKKYLVAVALVSAFSSTTGQSLKELLEMAEANYPLLKAKRYEVQATKDRVSLARSSALPTLDAAYQLDYATYNNITGMAVGQSFVPISGPPSSGNTYDPVFGSAGGLLLNWEPFTFGQRKSKIESARASQEYQEADAANELFQHKVRTINAYLDVVMTTALISVYNKEIERSQENVRIGEALTRSGLRPGTDTALFHAELARAKIELLNYEKLKAAQELALSEFVGGEATYAADDSSFFRMLPSIDRDTVTATHPMIRLSSSRVTMGLHQKTSLLRSLYPRISLWGTAYARGSGIRYDGYVNSEDGLTFSRYNYGAGLVLSIPLLRFASVRHEVNAQESVISADQERLNLAKLQLEKQNQIADVTLLNSLKIAHESPSFNRSAEFSYRTLKSRYNSGLVNYADLVQAQYTLIKSEADLKRAYIEAWKALLYKAAVKGDIDIFMDQIK
jgi:outer membrane protein TolC